eukprot:gene8303-17074_t
MINQCELEVMQSSSNAYYEPYSATTNLNYDRLKVEIMKHMSALFQTKEINHNNHNTHNKNVDDSTSRVFWKIVSDFASYAVMNDSKMYNVYLPALFNEIVDQNSDQWYPLHWAAACRDTSLEDFKLIAVECVRLKGNGNSAFESPITKRTPLHLASVIFNPNISIVKCINTIFPRMSRCLCIDGQLPLHYAAQYSNSITMIQELLQAYPDACKIQDIRGNTPLHLACINTSLEASFILDLLIQTCPAAVRIMDFSGKLPIHIITQNHNPAHDITSNIWINLLKSLLTSYPESAGILSIDDGFTPLHLAIKKDNYYSLEAVNIILSTNSLSATVPSHEGELPLHTSCNSLKSNKEYHTEDIISSLLSIYPEAASKIDLSGRYPLHNAAIRGFSKSIIQKLVDSYPAVLTTIASHDGTPIICSAAQTDVEIIKYLYLRCPAALHIQDGFGHSALHRAAASGYFEVLKLFYSYDPDAISYTCHNGVTPLFSLIFMGRGDVNDPMTDYAACFRFLLKNFPQAANMKCTTGDTPYTLCD